jgi:ADP-heptose:LPS heptosyltransferase
MKNWLIDRLVALDHVLTHDPESNDSSDAGPGPRILVVSTTALGDTLWATPVLSAIKSHFPESFVGIMATPQSTELLAHHPSLDAFFPFRDRSTPDCFRMYGQLRKAKFQTVLVFHATWRPVFALSKMTGASRILGFQGAHKGLDHLLTERIPKRPDLHGVDHRFELAARLGVTRPEHPRIELPLGREDHEAAVRYLATFAPRDHRPLVGFQPGANHSSRRWPLARFVSVARNLMERHNATVLVNGSPRERPMTEAFLRAVPNAISIDETVALRTAAAIIGRCRMFVTNDTGPMHIATALGVPTVCVFGAGTPESLPYHHPHVETLVSDGSSATSDDPRNLLTIEPPEVIDAVNRLWSRTAALEERWTA